MKKIIVLATWLGAFVGVLACSAAFAQHDMSMMEGDSKHAQCAMGGKKGAMGHGMGCGMSKKTVTATSDGGVVVMSGNQLYKYDKKLKFIDQAEIPSDEGAMGGGMMGMGMGMNGDAMKMCPMMKDDGSMMASGDAAEGPAAGSGSTAAASVDPADHAAHH